MKIFIFTLVALFSTLANADFVGLKGQSCSFIEKNFKILNDSHDDKFYFLEFGAGDYVVCDRKSFNIVELALTEETAKVISGLNSNSSKIDNYNLRAYQLLRKFQYISKPELEDGLEVYTVHYTDKGQYKFYVVEGKVVVIKAIWDAYLKNVEEVTRKNKIVAERTSYMKEMAEILGVRTLLFDYQFATFDKVTVTRDGCKINFKGSASERKHPATITKAGPITFDFSLDFANGIGWTPRNLYIEFSRQAGRTGTYWNKNNEYYFDRFQFNVEGVTPRINQLLNKLHNSCYKK
ncbi:hypothetical protein M899_1028 [Bacteriovorax sp. BSW11_IV]|uniref:hypothetical protein n=1 Tax=Bacteriovorax sp. BSW11_IV TaxID=1353529 RepID=UPI000389DEB2|nr:hypothetical protein [Bacteriovorax sp. BSW11_IV]EQC48710.1 hypothetical protein M899_1028 [Bacteriovorax sp. BSW11_IV]